MKIKSIHFFSLVITRFDFSAIMAHYDIAKSDTTACKLKNKKKTSKKFRNHMGFISHKSARTSINQREINPRRSFFLVHFVVHSSHPRVYLWTEISIQKSSRLISECEHICSSFIDHKLSSAGLFMERNLTWFAILAAKTLQTMSAKTLLQ